MKLNNHGWGIKELLIMSAILLILLLFVAYYIYVLYNKLDTSNAKEYITLETKLRVAAIKYNAKRGDVLSSGVVTLNELKNAGYIEKFNDEKGYPCNGYVVFENDDYDSYITCNDFTSKGYNKNNEK